MKKKIILNLPSRKMAKRPSLVFTSVTGKYYMKLDVKNAFNKILRALN